MSKQIFDIDIIDSTWFVAETKEIKLANKKIERDIVIQLIIKFLIKYLKKKIKNTRFTRDKTIHLNEKLSIKKKFGTILEVSTIKG